MLRAGTQIVVDSCEGSMEGSFVGVCREYEDVQEASHLFDTAFVMTDEDGDTYTVQGWNMDSIEEVAA